MNYPQRVIKTLEKTYKKSFYLPKKKKGTVRGLYLKKHPWLVKVASLSVL